MLRLGRKYRPPYQPATGKHAHWVVVSYPKSGRTWLKHLLREMDIHPVFTHLKSDHRLQIPYPSITADLSRYANWKVVMMVRHPLDTLVSGYFQAVNRVKVYDGQMSRFLEDDRHGFAKWIYWHHRMLGSQAAVADFHLLHYEDMRTDTLEAVLPVLKLWGIEGYEEKLPQAIEATTFDKMKAREADSEWKSINPKAGVEEAGFKVRRGKVGGYRDYLGPEQLERLRQKAVEMGMPLGYTW